VSRIQVLPGYLLFIWQLVMRIERAPETGLSLSGFMQPLLTAWAVTARKSSVQMLAGVYRETPVPTAAMSGFS
jgi:hypothetical protein